MNLQWEFTAKPIDAQKYKQRSKTSNATTHTHTNLFCAVSENQTDGSFSHFVRPDFHSDRDSLELPVIELPPGRVVRTVVTVDAETLTVGGVGHSQCVADLVHGGMETVAVRICRAASDPHRYNHDLERDVVRWSVVQVNISADVMDRVCAVLKT